MPFFLPVLGLLAIATPAAAEGGKRALLIGIGDYTYDVPDLEGPSHDVAALKQVLVERWGFPAAGVTTLMDGQATKANILAAFDALSTTTRPGDYVFVYYSGHGTSTYERSDLGLDNDTGALVPADVRLTAPDLTSGLVVGNRDLRPRLEKLDRDREVLAVFDSCYSGAAVRSLRAKGKPRYVELPRSATRSLGGFSEEEDGDFGSQTAKGTPYPYQHLVYISAASKAESARDITRGEITRGEMETVDGRPHGALTNFLLQALSGAADSNRDRSLTYGELYTFVRNKVAEEFPQQPQLLVPEASKDVVLASRAFPGGAVTEAPGTSASAPATTLRVRLDGVAPALARQIGLLEGVGLVTDRGYDLLFVQEPAGFKLYHGSGDLLASYPPPEGAEAVERVRRQAMVRTLLDLQFPGQDFNAGVSIPGNRGFLRKGDTFAIDLSAERESVFLLLDVDTSGHVSVLFPFSVAELSPRRSTRIPPSPDFLRVSPPFGTEYLKLFAFPARPAGIEQWMKASFPASDPQLDRLVAWLRSRPGTNAQDRLKVVTRESGS